MGKLPIWGTVQHCLSFCFNNLGSMLRLALIPILIVLVMTLLIPQPNFGNMMQGYSLGTDTIGLIVLSNVVGFLVMIQFITAWHRQFLSDNGQPRWFAFSFRGPELRYILMMILTTFVIIAALIIPAVAVAFLMANAAQSGEFSILGAVLMPVIWGLSIFLWARLSMVLPAAAIGAAAGLKDSWRATKGSVLRITAVQILLGLIILIPLAVLLFVIVSIAGASGVQDPESAQGAFKVLSVLLAPVQLFLMAIMISSLSAIYKFLSEKDNVVHAVEDVVDHQM